LKLGKASGPDDIMVEHLLYAHPSLVYHLCILFRSIATPSYVPKEFGHGIIVPLVKNKTGDLRKTDNYRGITLTLIISKLLECVILNQCADSLNTDELQFGFKNSLGCSHALFALKTAVDYFNFRGSTVL